MMVLVKCRAHFIWHLKIVLELDLELWEKEENNNSRCVTISINDCVVYFGVDTHWPAVA